MSIFSKKDNLSNEKRRGIATATTKGVAALVMKYDLPTVEAIKVFATAYATALAETVGEDPEEMFGAQLDTIKSW